MSSFKVYHKRGATNYKEKKMVSALEKVLSSRFEKEPQLASTFQPAKNFEELKSLHDRYCIEDAEITEIVSKEQPIESDVTEHEKFLKGVQETVEKKEPIMEEVMDDSRGFVDPFNDAEPIVRDYVLDDKKLVGGGDENPEEQESTNTSFEEPQDDMTAFELPNSDDERGTGRRNGNNNNNNNNNNKQDKEPKKPLNPSFDTMDTAKKKRSTKRFATMIVEATCLLAEKGCIWWTTKDITEDKLAEYEINGEMDLQILLTLEDNQQATVRHWLTQKYIESQTLFTVSKEDKSDLVDSLYEVMLEKGIAPTPMQELMINAVKTFIIDMGVKAFMFNQQIKSVLTQLKQLKSEEREEISRVQQEQPQQPQQPQATAFVAKEENTGVAENPAVVDDYLKDLEPTTI